MKDLSIQVHKLSKSYPKMDGSGRNYILKELDFSIKPGQVCGIIGANGSGKSTLLKLISGIVSPDGGSIELEGRVAAILELGTGFHPDLSGRDNIFFNAGLMGFDKPYVASALDDIIQFSELGDFIDAPVKTYSSGMYMRLAFSVAAFLKTDILLLDEVFSVGDQEFKLKCIQRLKKMKAAGVTILFVSHDFSQISAICDRCLLIKDGQISEDGHPAQVIDAYVKNYYGSKSKHAKVDVQGETITFWEDASHPLIRKFAVHSGSCFAYERSQPVQLRFTVEKTNEMSTYLSYVLYYRFNELSLGTASFYTIDPQQCALLSEAGVYTIDCQLPGGLLNTGHFVLELYLLDEETQPIMMWSDVCMLCIKPDEPPQPLLEKNPPQSSVFVKSQWIALKKL
jgi:ABC-type polysaccharide/polyol phosphate transport system ATPase subunit